MMTKSKIFQRNDYSYTLSEFEHKKQNKSVIPPPYSKDKSLQELRKKAILKEIVSKK